MNTKTARIPSRPVRKMPRSQLIGYAYDAAERDSFSADPEVQERADKALLALHDMSRSDLEEWASREIDWRMINR